MKRFLAPIFLLTFLFPSFAYGDGLMCKVTGWNRPEVVELSNLEKRERIFYKRFTEIPITGKVTRRFQGPLKDGKREGPEVSYCKDGNVKKKHRNLQRRQDDFRPSSRLRRFRLSRLLARI